MIVVGSVIGSGIFLVPSEIAARVGSVELMLAVWIAAGVLSLAGALAYAELGAALPGAGGLYVYLREAWGPAVAFLYGWALFLVIHSGSMATLAVAFSIYLGYLMPLGFWGGKLASAACILALTAVNVIGVKAGAVVQNLFGVLKVAGLLGLVLVAFLHGPAQESASALTPGTGVGFAALASGFGLAMVAALWAYEGWHLVTFSAGEFTRPQRNVPVSLAVGTASVGALYLLTNFAYLRVFSLPRIASAERVAAEVAHAAAGPTGASLIAAAIVISIFGATNGLLLTGPRVYYAMARDGLFFSAAGRVDPRFATPAPAILIQGLWATGLAMVGTFAQLFTYVIFTGWIFYGLGAAGVIRLRQKRPELDRPYRTFGYPVLPLLFVVAAAALVANTLAQNVGPSSAGLALVAAGLPVYWFWKRKA
jgi:APA family basic amino acid/polyamine antiporter